MKISLGILLILSLNFITAEVPDFIKSCADCHGENGVSQHSDIPTIAGASEIFIFDTMVAYKAGERVAIESKYRHGDLTRPETDMKKIANELEEDQIQAIAEYFSAKPFVAAKQEFNTELASKGEKVHQSRCRKCHEDGGSSPDDDSGILAGQWTPYLKESMKLYRNGERAMEDKMKKNIDKLSDQQVEALLNYYASQQ